MRVLTTLLAAALVIFVSACAPTQTPLVEARAAPEVVPVDEAEGVDIRIEVEGSFIATALAEQLANEPLTPQPGVEIAIIDPQFDLIPDNAAQVTATFDANVYGTTVVLRPTVTLLLSVEDGDIHVAIGGVSLGNVWFPLDVVEDELAEFENTIQEQLAGVLQGVTEATGLEVRSLIITDTALIMDLGR